MDSVQAQGGTVPQTENPPVTILISSTVPTVSSAPTLVHVPTDTGYFWMLTAGILWGEGQSHVWVDSRLLSNPAPQFSLPPFFFLPNEADPRPKWGQSLGRSGYLAGPPWGHALAV